MDGSGDDDIVFEMMCVIKVQPGCGHEWCNQDLNECRLLCHSNQVPTLALKNGGCFTKVSSTVRESMFLI